MSPGTIKARAGTIAFLFTIFFLNMLSRLGMAPLLPAMEEDLGLSHAAAGSLFLFVSVGYGTGLFFSAFLSARISQRHIIALSALAVGLSLGAASMSSGLGTLRASLLALGFSGGLYLPSGVATLTSIVVRGEWARVMGIHQLAPNSAYICAPLVADMLLGSYSWRFVVLMYGIASMILGGMFCMTRGAEGKRAEAEPPNLNRIWDLISDRTLWIMAVLFSLALGVNQGLFSILPLYLTTERQLAYDTANQLLALSRTAAFAMPLLAGWVADKYGLKRMMYLAAAASSGATLAITGLPNNWLGVGLLLQAMASVCFFPLGFTLLSRITTQAHRNIAVALIVPFSHFIGAGLTPTLIGTAADTGHFSEGVAVLGILTAIGLLLLRFVRIE
jgi:NNP family nitrate/nitrite transporter-like MFS transporter